MEKTEYKYDFMVIKDDKLNESAFSHDELMLIHELNKK